MVNSLAQVTLAGCPGVADFYQGNELWDQSLVDPDQSPSAWTSERRRQMLRRGIATPARGGCRCSARRSHRGTAPSVADGGIKLVVTAAGLRLRRERPDLFPVR